MIISGVFSMETMSASFAEILGHPVHILTVYVTEGAPPWCGALSGKCLVLKVSRLT